MATSQQCIDAMEAAVGRPLNEKEMEAVAKALDDRIRAKQAEVEVDGIDAVTMRAANELAEEAEMLAAIERRNAMLVIMRNDQFRGFVDRFTNKADGVEAYLVGTNLGGEGSRLSMSSRYMALRKELVGEMLRDLELLGPEALKVLRSGALDREIARDMWAIGRANDPGSGNGMAKRIAEVIHKYQETSRVRQNDAGAMIRKMTGYIFGQSHESARVKRATYEGWRNEILPRLDHNETFAKAGVEPEKIEDFLRAVYDDIVNNRHLNADGAENDLLAAFKGPANLGKKISRARKLHFKSADDFMDYHDRFGHGRMVDSIFRGQERAARNIVAMETLGPNPRALFDQVMADLRDAATGDAKDALDKNKIGWFIDRVLGEDQNAKDVRLAHVGSGFRAWQSMSRMGKVIASAFGDVPLMAIETRRHTGSFLDGYKTAFDNLFEGRGSAEKRQMAMLLGTGFDGTLQHIASRIDATDAPPGIISKAMHQFFRLNLLSWWTDSHKGGIARMFSRNLAMERNKAWSAVNADLRTTLGLFDIGEREWALLKKIETRAADGEDYVTGGAFRDLSDADIKAYLGDDKAGPRKIRETRRDLEQKFTAYIADRTDFAVLTPGDRETALFRAGTRPGTVLGEAVRTFMQFKSFPLTVIGRVLNPAIRERDAGTIAQALLAMTAFGYLSLSAKQIVSNREPPDPFDVETIIKSFVQGGGAGIYGDLLFADYNRFGGGLLETVGGPGATVISDVTKLFAKVRDGDDAAAFAYRKALENTPFLNLFYLRPAFDYVLGYSIQEAIAPGSLRRMEQRMQREQGRGFIIPPTP